MAKAASEGDEVKLGSLMMACDQQDLRRALISAASRGQERCLSLLGPRAELDDLNAAIQQAVRHNQREMVDAIVALADGRPIDVFALQIAALGGHDQCLGKLLSVCDPKEDNSRALLWALERDHPLCVKMLLPLSDIEAHSGGMSAKAFAEKAPPNAAKAEVLAFLIDQALSAPSGSGKAAGKPRL